MKKIHLLVTFLLLSICCYAQTTASRIVFVRMDAERSMYADMIMRNGEEFEKIRAGNVYVYNDTNVAGTYYLRPYTNKSSTGHKAVTVRPTPNSITFVLLRVSGSSPAISTAEPVSISNFTSIYNDNKGLRKELSKAGYESIEQLTMGFRINRGTEESYTLNDTTWYDSTGKQTSVRDSAASYIYVTKEKENSFSIKEYHINNHSIKDEGHLSSLSPALWEGEFIRYAKNGTISEKGSYHESEQVGIWYNYRDSTSVLWYTETYDGGNIQELTSYYLSGKLKRKQTYTDKKNAGRGYTNTPNSGHCYDETGTEIPFTPFEVMPKAPYDINQYLATNIKYPKYAVANNIQGRIVVRFVITEEGKVADAKIVKNLSPDTDIEALRVVSHMPPWLPGKQDDKPVKVYFNLPINFSLK